MKLSSLDTLPKEYFQHRLRFNVPIPKRRPGIFWLFFFGLSFFPIALLSIGTSADYSRYINIACYVISALHGLYIFPCLFFSSKKRIERYPSGCEKVLDIAMWMFQLEFWMTVTLIAMGITGTGGGNSGDSEKGAIAFSFALFVLLAGIATHIVMHRHIIRRIHEGHFRIVGGGFWGNRKERSALTQILIHVVAPVVIILGAASAIVGRFWTVIWNEAYNPIAMIVAPLLSYSMFSICAYGSAHSYIHKYYIKRFGIEDRVVVGGNEKKR